ncbi:DMT family transporter [Streptomyces sp. NPDC059740]|uniref:DMT family transporter n=1 Tax=Streptomyces sp. NPDC059740 TaxID=3346926 RepID=UPI0036634FA8
MNTQPVAAPTTPPAVPESSPSDSVRQPAAVPPAAPRSGGRTRAADRDGKGQANTPGPARRQPGGRMLDWRLRFGVLALIWGFSFLLIKVGTDSFAPLYVTLGRVVFGALVLLAVLVARRERLPRRPRTWAHLTVAALFLNALPFSLFAYAELTIPSTLAGICNSASPLWGMLLSLVALSEDRPNRRRVGGLVLGFLGVLTVLGAWQGFSGTDPVGTLLALVASLCYPVGWIYLRRTLGGAQESHLALSSAQMVMATVLLAAVTPFLAPAPSSLSLASLFAVLALGALGTGVAFLLQYGLVAEVGPTTAQMVTYFVPVIATAAGVTVLGEDLSWNTPVGALVTLAGAALTQTTPRRSRVVRQSPAPAR